MKCPYCGSKRTQTTNLGKRTLAWGATAVTYVVLAPEHPLVNEITTADCKEAVIAYQEASKAKSILSFYILLYFFIVANAPFQINHTTLA